MSLTLSVDDGDFSDLLENEGRVTVWPFIGELLADPYVRVHRRVYDIARSSYAPALADRTSYTNLLTYSADLTNGSWAVAGGAVTPAARANPIDGQVTASVFVENAVAATQHRLSHGFVGVLGLTYLVQAFVRRGAGARQVQLGLSGAASYARSYFNLDTGVRANSPEGTGGIIDLGNGWFFIWVTGVSDATGGNTAYFASTSSTATNSETYNGDGVSSIYWFEPCVRSGSTPGPIISTTSAARTVLVSAIDTDDRFAFLAQEMPPAAIGGEVVTVERFFARIPGPQFRPYKKLIPRPVMHGIKSGTSYAVSFDDLQQFSWRFDSRFAVTEVAAYPSSTSTSALPASSATLSASNGETCTFTINASAASIAAAIQAAMPSLGSVHGSASTGFLSMAWDGSPLGTYTVSITLTPVAGTTSSYSYYFFAFSSTGNTTTPARTSITAAGSNAVVGDRVGFYAGDHLVGITEVVAVTSTDVFSVFSAAIDQPDTIITHCVIARQATACYANGGKEVDVEDVSTFYKLGYSLKLATGGTVSAITDIPRQTAQMDPISWFAALIAGSTYAIESAAGTAQWKGPIVGYTYTRILMATAVDTVTP